MSVGTSQTISSATITVTDPLDGEYALIEVQGGLDAPADPKDTPDVFVAVPNQWLFPDATQGLTCTPKCDFANEFAEGTTPMRTRFEFKPRWQAASDGRGYFVVELQLPDLRLSEDDDADVLDVPSLACGEATCRGSVPLLVVTADTPLAPTAVALAEFDYPVLWDYDWQSPLTPYPRAGEKMGLQFNYPIAREPGNGYLPQFAVDGTNSSAQRNIEFHTFISGVLAAVAGALLLAAAQDVIAVVRERRSLRQ